MACFHEGKKPERRVEDIKKRIKTLKKTEKDKVRDIKYKLIPKDFLIIQNGWI